MNHLLARLQPAVRKETKRTAAAVGIGVILMWAVFGILHLISPQQVPFDYTVILGGIGGGVIAVLNFFLMAVTVQKVASAEKEDDARAMMKTSYSQRLLLQLLWVIVSIVVPFFQMAAGIAPLLFPSLAIKARAIFGKMK